jgi:hypothetical protein
MRLVAVRERICARRVHRVTEASPGLDVMDRGYDSPAAPATAQDR